MTTDDSESESSSHESDFSSHESDFSTHDSGGASESLTRNSTMFFPPDGKRSEASEPAEESSLAKLAPGDWIDGRYLVEEFLGGGGFGVVYRAFDSKLVRRVAIKIALNSNLFSTRHEAAGLIEEARATAKLDHANLVRVYDVGDWNNHTYAVMELVDGKSLEEELKEGGAFPLTRVFSICKDLLAAMSHMQEHGVVHRDLKPSNVLITERGKAKITDLGLAITDETPGTFQRRIAGTRRYMAPEQILGEIHRIDGRTDIWGFGLILYEMLALRPAFRQAKDMELFQAILRGDLESPKQSRDDIPDSLEAICFKCLSPRMALRFCDTEELATALNQAESDAMAIECLRAGGAGLGEPSSSRSNAFQHSGRSGATMRSSSDGSDGVPHVVPRGLRPFDAADQEYYMRLMPGPYDLQGKPAIVSTWKHWAENRNADAQPVGVIYGPSGCGKSSFAMAALIPSLNRTVRPIYCNLTVQDPVAGILATLHSELEFTQEFSELLSALASIRKRQLHYKVLLVLDQFEQYLAGHPIDMAHPMVQALRQCDGKYLQAILLVRNEYWNETSTLMQMLDQPLSDGSNASGLPMLSVPHAKRVLESFGRAYEAIPTGPIGDTQREFLDRAVSSLADDGQVLCVHLSIFAELMRQHTWDAPTLNRMGGANGVLSRFLSNAFDSIHAPMTFRASANVCADILRELVPDDERALKSSAQSISSLAAACNENPNSSRFRQAMRCLDQELHVLMKHRVEGQPQPYYSLSHDYLVQPIKNWLAVRDTETWKGRARSRLVHAAIRLKRDPSTRQLLTPMQWAAASFAVPKTLRSELQQKVMLLSRRRALGWIASFSALGLASALVATNVIETRRSLEASMLREERTSMSSFLSAKSENLFGIWRSMEIKSSPSRGIVKQLEKVEADNGPFESKQELRQDLLLSLAGLSLPAERICECLSQSDEHEMQLWEVALQDDSIRDRLWKDIQSKANQPITAGMPELERLFLKWGDMRLLTDISAAPDPMIKVYEILAVTEGSSQSELGKLAALLWLHSQKESKDAHYFKLIAIHILAMMERPINVIGKPLTDFIAQNIDSSDRATALSCQTLQTYLAGIRTVVAPKEESGEWMVESCIAKHPFVMIHLPVQRAQYEIVEMSPEGVAASKTKTLEVGSDVWLAREEVSVGLFSVFATSVAGVKMIDEESSPDVAVRSVQHEDIFRFCNWLSDKANLQPTYALGESPPEGTAGSTWIKVQNTNGIFWSPNANGYRLPTFQESALASVHGQPDHYWSHIGRHQGFQKRQVQREPALSPILLDCWMYFPNAWGFSGLMGNCGDVVLDDRNRLGFLPTTISSRNSWATCMPYERTNFRIMSFRLARGAQDTSYTPPE